MVCPTGAISSRARRIGAVEIEGPGGDLAAIAAFVAVMRDERLFIADGHHRFFQLERQA